MRGRAEWTPLIIYQHLSTTLMNHKWNVHGQRGLGKACRITFFETIQRKQSMMLWQFMWKTIARGQLIEMKTSGSSFGSFLRIKFSPCTLLRLNQSREIDQLNQHNSFLIGSMIFFHLHCVLWDMADRSDCSHHHRAVVIIKAELWKNVFVGWEKRKKKLNFGV